MANIYDNYLNESETYGRDDKIDTNDGSNIQAVLYVLGIDSIGNLIVRNKDNTQANVHLGWFDNIARLRIGGDGTGANNGFQIQGTVDRVLLDLDDTGTLSVQNFLNVKTQVLAPNVTALNPQNQLATLSLNWLNNIARIRVGGTGNGSVNGLQIQGTGDRVLFSIDDNGGTNPFVIQNGIVAQENRIGASLVNSWVNYSNGWATASYYKDRDNRVHLTGLIRSGVTTAGTLLFSLPSGYRPEAREMFDVLCGNETLGRVDVWSDGQVNVQLCPNNTYLRLSGISFRAS